MLHFTAVHPLDIREALREVGFTRFGPDRFYQVDSTLLEPAKTTVYLCRHKNNVDKMDPTNFRRYDPQHLEHYRSIPVATLTYYQEVFKLGKRPLLYNRIPHILYKGSLRVSDLPILTV